MVKCDLTEYVLKKNSIGFSDNNGYKIKERGKI